MQYFRSEIALLSLVIARRLLSHLFAVQAITPCYCQQPVEIDLGAVNRRPAPNVKATLAIPSISPRLAGLRGLRVGSRIAHISIGVAAPIGTEQSLTHSRLILGAERQKTTHCSGPFYVRTHRDDFCCLFAKVSEYFTGLVWLVVSFLTISLHTIISNTA